MTSPSRGTRVLALFGLLGGLSIGVLLPGLLEPPGDRFSPSLFLVFPEEQDLGGLREVLQTLKGPDGRPRYPNAEVQTLPDRAEARKLLRSRARRFQVRLDAGDREAFAIDLRRWGARQVPPIEIQVLQE